MAGRGLGLVYGGASVGTMGMLADAALEAGTEVIGVIPRSLRDAEVAHPRLTRLEVVDSMHARKARMADLSDGFVALPGGYGTLDELFEILTWAQLGLHQKPIGLLDLVGFYRHLRAHLEHALAEGFVRPQHRVLLRIEEDPERLLDGLTRAAAEPATDA